MTTKKKVEKTADQMYQELQERMRVLIAKIEIGMKLHSAQQAEDKRNWGYTGDLGHAIEALERVALFLNQEDR